VALKHPNRLRRRELKQPFATQLRQDATEAERKLWTLLRRHQVASVHFRRQQPIGPYIVDFYCSAAKLIIELDGDQHGADKAVQYDEVRTLWLTAQGYTVLRFPNRDVFQNSQVIVDAIVHVLEERGAKLLPSP
jgi:very-short-patch-repair endonuclease